MTLGTLAGLALAALWLPAGARADVATPGESTSREATGVGIPAVVDAVAVGPSVEQRLAEIQRRIQQVLAYPPIARKRDVRGKTVVSFRVRADGTAERVEVAHSSGHPVLDRAATDAVTTADRLPYVSGRLEVPVRFELTRRERGP